jgi:Pyruvate/2-oxoacid:ferredoxin oxidoreductase delta subunit
MEAAMGYYENIGNDAEKVDFNPDFMPAVSISRAVLDAEIIISLPKFKTHGLTIVTGGIKNSYGFLPGAQKARLHKAAGSPARFHEAIVDVFRLRIPDLFILDAVVGMEGNGPASPDLRDIGLILASDNAVALDAVVAWMMGCDPGRLRFLQRAHEMGLGDYEISRIEVIGELKRLPDFKLPPLGGEALSGNKAAQELIYSRTILRPKADPELCTACGTCVDQCAVSALSMGDDNLPQVDADTCITCFCCQEICPEKAITLQ